MVISRSHLVIAGIMVLYRMGGMCHMVREVYIYDWIRLVGVDRYRDVV